MTRHFLLATILLAAPWSLHAQDSLTARIERIGTLRSPKLSESSGVAVSRTHPGILWTHNDSGDSAVFYATNYSGDLLGTYHIPGASANDWEDMTLGPCPHAPGPCLFFADTGDNSEQRESVTLFVVREPQAPQPGGGSRYPTEPARELRLRYPDGSHDVEAIAADPLGDLYLFTKGRTAPIRVYRVPRAAFDGDSAIALLVDSLPIAPWQALGRWVTGASISPSGERLVVRTYTELYFFGRESGKLVPEGACWLGGAEPQGEAVDFLEGLAVVLTSETVQNQLGPVLKVTCPAVRPRGQRP
jgi:hypothetical protein